MPNHGKDKYFMQKRKGKGGSSLVPVYPEDKGDYLMFGQQLIKALNTRIVYLETTIEYYQARLTELQTSTRRNSPYSKGNYEKMSALIVRHQSLIDYYKSLRDKVYAQADFVTRNETEDYQKVFKAIFLDGLKVKEICMMFGMTTSRVKAIIRKIQYQMFDERY